MILFLKSVEAGLQTGRKSASLQQYISMKFHNEIKFQRYAVSVVLRSQQNGHIPFQDHLVAREIKFFFVDICR